MVRRCVVFYVFQAALTALAPAWAVEEADTPLAVCPMMPEWSGNWTDAPSLSPFVTRDAHELATPETEAWLICTGSELQLRFRCADPRIQDLKAPSLSRDATNMWEQDCVELFIAPGDPRREYYHIILSAANDVLDERVMVAEGGRDLSWSADARTEVNISEDQWACDIRLPVSALGTTPRPGDRWRMNFTRGFRGGQQFITWSPVEGTFHHPQAFGTIVFAEQAAVLDVGFEPPFVGANRVPLRLSPGAHVRARVELTGASHRRVTLPVPEGTFPVEQTGESAVQLSIEADNGQVVRRTSPVRFEVPEVAADWDETEGYVQQAHEALQQVPVERMPARDASAAGFLLRRIESLKRWVAAAPSRDAEDNRARWSRAIDERGSIEDTAKRLTALAGFLASHAGPPPALMVGTETSLRKLHPTDWDFRTAEPMRLAAARREVESGQIVLAGLQHGVRIEDIACSSLRSRAGAEVAAEQVRVYRVGYVTTRPPSYPVDYVGEWPDPLLPFEPFELQCDRIQPLWVTVTVPPDASAGEYTGNITITDGDGNKYQVALELTVWDFELPLRSRLKTLVSTGYAQSIAPWYGWHGSGIPEEFLLKFYDLMLSHRLNPVALYDDRMWPPVEHLDYCAERGLNAVILKCTGTAEPEEIAEVKHRLEELAKHGLDDSAYMYGHDEAPEELWPEERELWLAWKRAIPEIQTAATIQPNDIINDVVDLWVLFVSWYDDPAHKALVDERLAAGDTVWLYIACKPLHPYANWFIDYPATDHRILFWQLYKLGIPGFLYYNVTLWGSNMHVKPEHWWEIPPDDPEVLDMMSEGKRWPEIPWNTYTFYQTNGDGQLVYPGPNATPLPSIRLEAIRDGIEDYDMLSVLDEVTAKLRKRDPRSALIAQAEELLAVRAHVVQDLTHFTSSPDVIEDERVAIAEHIEAIQEALGEPSD